DFSSLLDSTSGSLMWYCAHLLQLSIVIGVQVLSTAAIHLLSWYCIILALAVNAAADAHLLSYCCFLLKSSCYLPAVAAAVLAAAAGVIICNVWFVLCCVDVPIAEAQH
ncbi:hypothetical protein MAM1_1265c11545, partial [Mucor ambiguus]